MVVALSQLRWAKRHGYPDLRFLRKSNTARHHANHRVFLVIQRNLAADNGGVTAEAALPEAVADQDHARTARSILFGGKVPPEYRRNTEQGKQIGSHRAAFNLFRRARASERVQVTFQCCHVLKDMIPPLPI